METTIENSTGATVSLTLVPPESANAYQALWGEYRNAFLFALFFAAVAYALIVAYRKIATLESVQNGNARSDALAKDRLLDALARSDGNQKDALLLRRRIREYLASVSNSETCLAMTSEELLSKVGKNARSVGRLDVELRSLAFSGSASAVEEARALQSLKDEVRKYLKTN